MAVIDRHLTKDSFVFHEVPSPDPADGTATFAMAYSFVTGSLQVFRDKSRLEAIDIAEDPGAGTFTVTATQIPDSDENLEVSYIRL